MGKIIGFMFIALGGYLIYSGFKRIITPPKLVEDGVTVNEMMNQDLNKMMRKATKSSLSWGCGAIAKVMSGLILLLIGVFIEIFAAYW